MPRHRGTTMNKAKRAKVVGDSQMRNSGGRPPKQSTEAEGFASPADHAPSAARVLEGTTPATLPVPRTNPAPTPPLPPSAAAHAIELFSLRPPSSQCTKRATLGYPNGTSVSPEEARRIEKEITNWDNIRCSCLYFYGDTGEPCKPYPRLAEHTMFCQMFKCYAWEVGCCG